MLMLKVLLLNVFAISTFQRVGANSLDVIQDGFHIASLVSEVASEQEYPIIVEAEEIFLDNVLTSDSNKTGNECAAAGNSLIGFIQCAVQAKIESFRLELSKVGIPDQPPEGLKPRVMDSKIEGSLEEWFQKYKKYVDALNV